jgi:putative ABC transporter ATP-binding protein albC
VPLLILDEPVDGLDFEGTEFLYDSLNAYRDTGSVLMSSHVAESFTRCCDHLYVLDGGDLSRPYPLDPATDIRALLKERHR